MRVPVEIAPGELFDKLTILEIKAERITDPEKMSHIAAERETLERSRVEHLPAVAELDELRTRLKSINEALWDIEDSIRDHEREGTFDEDFIQLARDVYRTNDQRAEIKRRINAILGSDIAEAKSYRPY